MIASEPKFLLGSNMENLLSLIRVAWQRLRGHVFAPVPSKTWPRRRCHATQSCSFEIRYRIGIVSFLVLGILSPALVAFADTDPNDPMERSMRFVEQSAKATELYNAGKFDQALAIFQDLLRAAPNLDEDGYVEMSTGDCLAALKRTDEARTAYTLAGRLHPDLQAQVDRKLGELDLAGPVSDDLVNRLRTTTQGSEDTRFSSNLLLGRALQKRATALLAEAVSAFQTAVDHGSIMMKTEGTNGYVATLKGILKDLQTAGDRMDTMLGTPTRPATMKAVQSETSRESEMCKLDWQWLVTQKPKATVNLRITSDKAGKQRVTADGRTVPLTDAQQLLIKHHQQRINEIILDTLRQSRKSNSNPKGGVQ